MTRTNRPHSGGWSSRPGARWRGRHARRDLPRAARGRHRAHRPAQRRLRPADPEDRVNGGACAAADYDGRAHGRGPLSAELPRRATDPRTGAGAAVAVQNLPDGGPAARPRAGRWSSATGCAGRRHGCACRCPATNRGGRLSRLPAGPYARLVQPGDSLRAVPAALLHSRAGGSTTVTARAYACSASSRASSRAAPCAWMCRRERTMSAELLGAHRLYGLPEELLGGRRPPSVPSAADGWRPGLQIHPAALSRTAREATGRCPWPPGPPPSPPRRWWSGLPGALARVRLGLGRLNWDLDVGALAWLSSFTGVLSVSPPRGRRDDELPKGPVLLTAVISSGSSPRFSIISVLKVEAPTNVPLPNSVSNSALGCDPRRGGGALLQ